MSGRSHFTSPRVCCVFESFGVANECPDPHTARGGVTAAAAGAGAGRAASSQSIAAAAAAAAAGGGCRKVPGPDDCIQGHTCYPDLVRCFVGRGTKVAVGGTTAADSRHLSSLLATVLRNGSATGVSLVLLLHLSPVVEVQLDSEVHCCQQPVVGPCQGLTVLGHLLLRHSRVQGQVRALPLVFKRVWGPCRVPLRQSEPVAEVACC
jgi:hypothetical protein